MLHQEEIKKRREMHLEMLRDMKSGKKDDFMLIAPPHLDKELNKELRREELWK